MSSSQLGLYGKGLHDQNRDSGVRHVLIARVLQEARQKERHLEESLAFGEWTQRYFGFGQEQAVKRMAIGHFPLDPLTGKDLAWHQLEAAKGASEPVLAPLLEHAEGLSPEQITKLKRAGAAWVKEGRDRDEVAALVAQAARAGTTALAPDRRHSAERGASALSSGKLGRQQVLAPLHGALRAVTTLRERRLGGEVFSGTWPGELKEAMRALLWQVPELLGEDPRSFLEALLTERRAAPREERTALPAGEDPENDKAVEELAEASAPAGAAGGEDEALIAGVLPRLSSEQRAWLGERLFHLLRGDPAEHVAAALATMYERCRLGEVGIAPACFERWRARLCHGGDDHGDRLRGWDAAFALFKDAELPGFREQLYLLRTYPLGAGQRASVEALCQLVALYPREAEPPAPPGSVSQAADHPLGAEVGELLRDMNDLRRLHAEVEDTWSEEAPLSLDVQCLLFEEQMDLEKAIRKLKEERRARDALRGW